MHKLWLTYEETYHVFEGYTDADGSMNKNSYAITVYAFLIDSGAVL